MRMYDLIEKKKNAGALSAEELAFLVHGFTAGAIPDEQMAAFAMAVCFQGMNGAETAALTMEMAQSGDQVDLSALGPATVDKHSTGGVGDKTTLIVAPLVAALGGKVAKMSGRGLGHTGGTIDKLESIPGYRTVLDERAFLEQVQRIGVAVVGQSGNLAPADKKLYALRDVTATVDSMPLIASSIMSKKLAAGAHSIVLDVKVGSGAFMKTAEEAEQLADCMVKIGQSAGRRMAALITNMDRPLGFAVGNALEVAEAVAVLRGRGPKDLTALCLALAAEMLALSRGWLLEESRAKAEEALHSGMAFAKMKEWIAAQGGDCTVLDQPERLPGAAESDWVLAEQSGYIARMDAEKIGIAAMMLGAGRLTKEASIDYGAGLMLLKKTGDFANRGEPLARLYTNRVDTMEDARRAFLSALSFAQALPEARPLIIKRVGG